MQSFRMKEEPLPLDCTGYGCITAQGIPLPRREIFENKPRAHATIHQSVRDEPMNPDTLLPEMGDNGLQAGCLSSLRGTGDDEDGRGPPLERNGSPGRHSSQHLTWYPSLISRRGGSVVSHLEEALLHCSQNAQEQPQLDLFRGGNRVVPAS